MQPNLSWNPNPNWNPIPNPNPTWNPAGILTLPRTLAGTLAGILAGTPTLPGTLVGTLAGTLTLVGLMFANPRSRNYDVVKSGDFKKRIFDRFYPQLLIKSSL